MQQPPRELLAGGSARRRRKVRRILWGRLALAMTVLLGFLAVIGWVGLYSYYNIGILEKDPTGAASPPPVVPGEPVNILLLGVDKEGERSDTLMLLSYDPERKRAGVLQIPRDTRARIAGRGYGGYEKIAHANAYWDSEMSGPQRAMRTVSDLVGVPVHKYVTVNFALFVRLIDTIGGVDFNVPFPMCYYDPYQNFRIRLNKGMQHLDGKKALQLVRYRQDNCGDGGGYTNGDLGRIEMQQRFMQAAFDKMLTAGSMIRLPVLALDFARNVGTNIELNELVGLARVASGLGRQDVEWAVLPGEPGDPATGYFLPDPVKIQSVVQQLFPRTARPARVPTAVSAGTSARGPEYRYIQP